MQKLNPKVDEYLAIGCGRCPLGNTPECKVHKWTAELEELRNLALQSGLTEERKWGVPCYTYNGANICIVSAFKDFCSVSFFKGALLNDPHNILEFAGPNSQHARLIKLRSLKDVKNISACLPQYFQQAIELEKSGAKVQGKSISEIAIPDELEQVFNENPLFKAAFKALTPGRQRGYIINFSQPKQSATRMSRILKYMPDIMAGKGIHDGERR